MLCILSAYHGQIINTVIRGAPSFQDNCFHRLSGSVVLYLAACTSRGESPWDGAREMASGVSGTAQRTSPPGPEAVTSPAAEGVTSPAAVGVTSSAAAAATVGAGTRRKRVGWGAAPTMGLPAGPGPDRDCITNIYDKAYILMSWILFLSTRIQIQSDPEL